MSEVKAQQILEALNAAKVRATYGAVAQVLGIHPRTVVKHLGARRPEASWVVNAKTGLPSVYSESEIHANLTQSQTIIRTGDELSRLLNESAPDTSSVPRNGVRLAGIDLAWKAHQNESGIAIGLLKANKLLVGSVRSEVLTIDTIASIIDSIEDIRGTAIDAPLIIKNESGSRPCEKALNKKYQRYWAGAHPTNLQTPWKSGVELAENLVSKGFHHLGRDHHRWQIECYPHPAIVEMFGLEKRLKYKGKKRMSLDDVRDGQIALANHLLSLGDSQTLKLRFPESIRSMLAPEPISQLTSTQLKSNEDALDAIVCLYIAGLFEIEAASQTFGDVKSGYIYVPTNDL